MALATIPRIWPWHHAAFAREQMQPSDSHPGAARIPAGHELSCGHTGLCGEGLRPAQARDQQGLEAFRQICDVAPFSATAEALRYIKVAIDLHPTGAKVIGFVSALPGEGKTTVAGRFRGLPGQEAGPARCSLTPICANPSMTRTLDYTDARGLLELVADKSPFAELVKTDAKHKFDFLASSTRIRPTNSSDILNSSVDVAPPFDTMTKASNICGHRPDVGRRIIGGRSTMT